MHNKNLNWRLHFPLAFHHDPRELQHYLIKFGNGKMTLANGHNIKYRYKPVSIPLADKRTIQVKVRPIKTQILRNKLVCNATHIKIAVCSSECTTCRGGESRWKRGFTASWQGVNDAERIKTNRKTLVGSFRCPMFEKINTLTLLLYVLF